MEAPEKRDWTYLWGGSLSWFSPLSVGRKSELAGRPGGLKVEGVAMEKLLRASVGAGLALWGVVNLRRPHGWRGGESASRAL